jgi:hypothetical protein
MLLRFKLTQNLAFAPNYCLVHIFLKAKTVISIVVIETLQLSSVNRLINLGLSSPLNYSSNTVATNTMFMSRQLRTLLKQNRVLEEKLFYEPRESDWREQLITPTELSDALTYLSNSIIENKSNELCVLKMLNDIKSITGRPLSSYDKNALQVVELLFNYIREYSKFDPKYYHVLNSLQLAFTRLSLNDLSFLDNSKHVAVKFLEKLIKLGHHFDNNAGKLAQFFIHAIELLTNRLANQEKVTNQTFISASKKLEEYFDGFNDKATNNINRVFSDIEKESRVAQADIHTKQLIKTKTDGEEIPIFLLDFFENHLSAILHATISQHGTNSKQCQQLLTDMDTLSWSITHPLSDEEYKQRFDADVADTMKRLYQLFETKDSLNEYVRDFFFETEELHTKKLNGQRISYDVMISADIFADEGYEEDNPNAWLDEPGQNDSYAIETLEEGQWYYLTVNDTLIQARLLLINDFTKKLIFINLSGEVTHTTSFDDTKFLTQHCTLIPENEQIGYRHATKSLIRELSSRLEILKVEYQQFLKNKAQDALDQIKEEEKSRQAIQQKIKEDRRQHARRQLEKERKEQEKQAAERLQDELNAKQRFQIKAIYRKLTPGTLIAFKSDTGNWKEATLTLISKTTQKHIFSDNKGSKVLDPTKDEILLLIKAQKLKILKPAEQPVDPMQSLVMQRRKKLQSN